jgi:DNA-binding NarL/FixJ family response regulator/anti-sigma regulatory factor (Ser/Thr protein kinase)
VQTTHVKRSVLVVDDDPVFREIARAVLAEAGFDVITACDVESARAVFARMDIESLACVLVDYGLPDGNGIELAEWLNRRYSAVATVLVTASPDHSLLERSLSARVCAFLGKPLEPADFRRAVATAASITTQRRAGAEMREQVENARSHQKRALSSMLRSGEVSLEHRFHPRYYTSGDFLSYYAPAESQHIFLMSDAAGHDLRAAVHSAYFQGMLKGFLISNRSLAESLAAYNSVLVDGPVGGVSSLSVTAMAVDRAAGCVSAWNFGGPPPAFIDSLGWIRTIGARSSSPLGWFEDPQPTFDRVGIPPGPIWMWTDGLEDLADRMDSSPLSMACALLSAQADESPAYLAKAEDDVLVARIWPGIRAGATPFHYEQPLIAEEYSRDQISAIDRLQARWVHSLQLALPALSESVRYDLILSAREAVLNALKHGCSSHDCAQFQVSYESSESALRVRVRDPGPGYRFDVEEHAAEDAANPVELHRGLILMHAHAGRVERANGGSEVIMEFPLDPRIVETTTR